MKPEDHYLELAAAFVRGHALRDRDFRLPAVLRKTPLDEYTEQQRGAVFRQARTQGLQLDMFKRATRIPRVAVVVELLRAFAPQSVLDVGCGRGPFLWAVLDAMPRLPVTAVDRAPRWVKDVQNVHRGGIERLTGHLMDAMALDFDDDAFDAVVLLDVLPYVEHPVKAVDEATRVARRLLVLSLPLADSSDPEHLHTLDEPTVLAMLSASGWSDVKCTSATGHLIAVARKA